MNKISAIAAAVALTMGTGALIAGPMTSATFTMLSPGGGAVGVDTTVNGAIGGGTWSVASTTPFFGLTWTAHSGTTFGPGTYSFPTIQGGTYTGVVVGPGQVGGHILFNWGSTADIDVVNVWNEVCVPQPTFLECTYTSTDPTVAGPVANPDGFRGIGMIDGAFPGFNANFDFVATFPLAGAPTFTPPTDVTLLNTTVTATPATVQVDLGTVTDEAPGSALVYYSIDGKAVTDPTKTWIPDDNATNTISYNLTQTINTLGVDWKAENAGSATTDTQTVTVTIDDQVAPVITSTNAPPINVNVTSTADSVCFGAIAATDAIEPNLTIEWSHDGFNWTTANPDTGNLTDNCSTGFGPDTNILNWRAVDVAGNTSTYQQTVILNLPVGVTGKACTIDLATAGPRLVDGQFVMRDPTGAIAGSIDPGVTGDVDTTVFCTDPDIANCNPVPPAVSLLSGQPFFGFGWTASPVRLFGPDTSGPVPQAKTWTFEACPFPRTFDPNAGPSGDWIAADGSTKCIDASTPNPISMTVNPGQIGAHMLFDWSVNVAIDVVVVWDVGCNKYMLTTTDPDGDGILSTPMVDGPFKGFNAAFDLNTVAGEPPISDGGYTVTIPSVQNPVAGESPIPLTTLALPTFPTDPAAARSCVGGCFKFTTTILQTGNDSGGSYQFARVVLPLTEKTPFWSLYRKFDENTQTWKAFTINGRNNVLTAPLDPVSNECPEPGNGAYDRPISGALDDKLRENDWCVQLLIEDNGPNDANPTAGVIDDPSGVAEVSAGVLPSPSTGGGGCALADPAAGPVKGGAWLLLGALLGWLGWSRRRH